MCAAKFDFDGNLLTGTIPSEIGLLSDLGEFVIEDKMKKYTTRSMPIGVVMFVLPVDLMLSCLFCTLFHRFVTTLL